MRDVSEVKLPGVGVRHEFRTDAGRQVGVLVHHDGHREILIYDQGDNDTCSSVELSHDDTRTLSELLGATQVVEEVQEAQHEIEGQSIAWIRVDENGARDGTTIGSGEYRTRTGASMVAVLRDGEPMPSPEADFVLEAGDLIVAVGSADSLDELRTLLGA
ncbi:MAG: TrkA C-terminal domain-containing protein [Acidimicrobiales bacterium]|nr:TrkA C-terminal domain-containing protein [Acidimicrobiales bacterium]